MKASNKKSRTPDSNTTIMKTNKAMAQKIKTKPIGHPKTPKEFYYHMNFWKSIMNRPCVTFAYLLCCDEKCLIYPTLT